MSPFECFRETLTAKKRELTEDELKDYSQLMTNRIVSMVEPYVGLANEMNKMTYRKIPSATHHRVLRMVLPSRNLPYTYLKKNKADKGLVEAVARRYGLGSRDAEIVAREMDEESAKRLLKDVKELG